MSSSPFASLGSLDEFPGSDVDVCVTVASLSNRALPDPVAHCLLTRLDDDCGYAGEAQSVSNTAPLCGEGRSRVQPLSRPSPRLQEDCAKFVTEMIEQLEPMLGSLLSDVVPTADWRRCRFKLQPQVDVQCESIQLVAGQLLMYFGHHPV